MQADCCIPKYVDTLSAINQTCQNKNYIYWVTAFDTWCNLKPVSYTTKHIFDAILYSICCSSFYVTTACFDVQILYATRRRYKCDTNHRVVLQNKYTSAERCHVKRSGFDIYLNAKKRSHSPSNIVQKRERMSGNVFGPRWDIELDCDRNVICDFVEYEFGWNLTFPR